MKLVTEKSDLAPDNSSGSIEPAASAKPLGLLILMPTRGAVSIETMLCLREHLDGYPCKLLSVHRKPVIEASTELFRQARELDVNALPFEPKYIMGIPDDVWWPAGMLARAVEILEDNPDVGMVSPIGGWRIPFSPPSCVPLQSNYASAYGKLAILKCKPDDLIPLRMTSGGIMRREVLEVITDEPFKRIPCPPGFESPYVTHLPEDLSYTYRLTKAGVKIVTERSLIIGHVDVKTGLMYLPNAAPMRANGADFPTPCDDAANTANPDPSMFSKDARHYFEDQEDGNDWRRDISDGVVIPETAA